MADVLENLLAEIALNQRHVLVATLYSFSIATRLFQKAERELTDKIPDQEETRNHEWILGALLRLGHFCEARLEVIEDKNLSDYHMSRAQILADLGELEELAEERKKIL
jgi:hypothetical protein